jgi:hypothetical protein
MVRRQAFLFGRLDALGDPTLQVLHGVATDTKLDQMEGHFFDLGTNTLVEWI